MRLRPRSLDEVVGQQHLVAPGAPLRTLIESDRVGSAILWGPAGSGKTTLARLIAKYTSKVFVPGSAVTAGVKEVRGVLEEARRRRAETGRGTILFLDEVHRFNKAQQDVLLPAVEEGLIVLIGATTENPFFELNAPLLSRSTLWRLEPLDEAALAEVVRRGLEAEGVEAEPDAVGALIAVAEGDARAALTMVELAAVLARQRGTGAQGAPGAGPAKGAEPAGRRARITRDDLSRARGGRLFHQGADEHYDQVSALIKSIRGSDPDAGLYWMVRMLEAGEDPRFIARRLVILASEDVGLADPQALLVAAAAAQAVEFVGLPEASLNLAEAVVYLATAPKSNRVTVALGRAKADVACGPRAEVPVHLRDAHYRGAATIGHGTGYRYPHDEAGGWVEQQYRPAALERHIYYEPSAFGEEAEIARRIQGQGSASRRSSAEPSTSAGDA